MNAYRHAHVSGVLLSLNDNGGDYFFLARAVRNVAEWISAQTSLPNNLQMPCNLPLPIPAFNINNPLKLNPTTHLYHQPSNNDITYIIKDRFNNTRSIEARAKISDNSHFSPPLQEDPDDGDVITYYKVDAVGSVFITLSDGAAAISAGLGAAFPSVDHMHVECWSHMYPMSIKNLFNNSQSLGFTIPESAVSGIECNKEKKKVKAKLKRKVIDFIISELNKCRSTISAALAECIFDNFCSMISTGMGNRSVKIQLPELSNQLRSKYSRVTINASYGCWRKSDVCNLSLDQFDSHGLPQFTTQRISNFVSGIPTSQSSIEAINARTKIELQRKPREVVQLMEFFNEFISDTVQNDYKFFGFSYAALPYGSGTSSSRASTREHSASIADGMLFLGHCYGRDQIFDQRSYYHIDVSVCLCLFYYLLILTLFSHYGTEEF